MKPDDLLSELRMRFPEGRPRLTIFPSGSYMIDLEHSSEEYVVEYSSVHQKFGLSRLSSGGIGWTGFEMIFDTKEELVREVAKIFV